MEYVIVGIIMLIMGACAVAPLLPPIDEESKGGNE